MSVNDQSWEAFANNRIVFSWAGILDPASGEGALLDMTNRIAKFSVALLSNGEPVRSDPLIDHSTEDDSPQVVSPNPVAGSPHVQATVFAAETIDLAPVTTTYHVELEVFDVGSTIPVVVATGQLKLKPNVDNE